MTESKNNFPFYSYPFSSIYESLPTTKYAAIKRRNPAKNPHININNVNDQFPPLRSMTRSSASNKITTIIMNTIERDSPPNFFDYFC